MTLLIKGEPKLVSLVREETPSKPHKFNFMKSFEEGFDPDAQTEDDQYNFRVKIYQFFSFYF